METELKQDAVQGGKEVEISKVDGTLEKILVRHCTPRQVNRMLDWQTEEWRIVTMLCGKSDAWVDGVSPTSFLTLVRLCHEINRDFLSQAVRYRMDRLKEWSPKKAQEIENELGSVLAISSSDSPSPVAAHLNNS